MISKWFRASELSLVLGICISFPKLGSALNAAVSPAVAEKFVKDANAENVGVPLLIGLGLMIISLIFALGLAYIDKRSAEKEKVEHESLILSKR